MKNNLTLSEAKKAGKVEKFIKEHENDEPANKEKFKKIVSSVSSGKKK